MAKLNIGNALDSDGNWEEALAAFEESYRYGFYIGITFSFFSYFFFPFSL